MGFKRSFVGICLVLLALAWSTPARSASPIPMKTAWLGEHETFAVWYAKQKGWDKEAGLDLTMLRFDSGKAIVEGVLAYDWAIAGCGAVPALTATLSERLDIIAVANDESAANALYVRADSPLLSITVEAYKRLFAKDPEIRAIHAGLECGLFSLKYPHVDMVSFGPTLRGVHSPEERLLIPTVQKVWEHLLETLKNIPAK